jgi:multidrug efflux pump subunit AcrA (membrane-fusion protein)
MQLQPKLAHAAEQEKAALPIVTVVHPTKGPPEVSLSLPGDIESFQETAISARANGYLQQWLVDIGDRVKAGQTLALISTPDADLQTKQAGAQVANSEATVQQSKANVAMMDANTDQAIANLSRSKASLQQAKTDLSHSEAAVAQAVQVAEQQKAQVVQAQANLDLAKVTSDRYALLAQQGAVAQQTADQELASYKTNLANVDALKSALQAAEANVAAARAAVKSSEANVKAYADGVLASRAAVVAAEANVVASKAGVSASDATLNANNANYKRNAVLQSFQRVVAPFDGVITSRNVDVGALVSASGNPTVPISSSGSGPSTGSPTASSGLFTMARTDRVRIFVSLPQNFAESVQPGQTAKVFVQELGNEPVLGKIVRNTSSLDPTTRTLRTEIQLDNSSGQLRPGMFATVELVIPQQVGLVRIPDSSLITDANGTRVALVTSDNKIHFQTVTVGTDYGKEMDITAGLTGTETIVGNPTAALQEGMSVQTIDAPVLPAPGSAPTGQGKRRKKS